MIPNEKLREQNWFKVGLVLIALLAVLFGNNYLQEKNAIEREQFNQQLTQQKEQKDREFDASQKDSCLSIYKQESTKWNNVTGWRYDDVVDKCYIEYKQNPPRTTAQCDSSYKDEKGNIYPSLFMSYLLCKEGKFENSF